MWPPKPTFYCSTFTTWQALLEAGINSTSRGQTINKFKCGELFDLSQQTLFLFIFPNKRGPRPISQGSVESFWLFLCTSRDHRTPCDEKVRQTWFINLWKNVSLKHIILLVDRRKRGEINMKYWWKKLGKFSDLLLIYIKKNTSVREGLWHHWMGWVMSWSSTNEKPELTRTEKRKTLPNTQISAWPQGGVTATDHGFTGDFFFFL